MSDSDSRRQDAEMQQVIVRVLEHHAHRPVPEILRALQVEMIRHRLQVPPEPWLEAVAYEVAEGRLYVVSTGANPFGRRRG